MSEPWSRERHEAARDYLACADRGPWKRRLAGGYALQVDDFYGERIVTFTVMGNGRAQANARFMVEARSDLPDALSRIEALEAALRSILHTPIPPDANPSALSAIRGMKEDAGFGLLVDDAVLDAALNGGQP